MKASWNSNPVLRPRFADLLPKLEALRSKPHLQVLFNLHSKLWG